MIAKEQYFLKMNVARAFNIMRRNIKLFLISRKLERYGIKVRNLPV